MDHLSEGRVEFGTGRGSSSAEWARLRHPVRRRDQADVARVARADPAHVARRALRVRGQVLPHAASATCCRSRTRSRTRRCGSRARARRRSPRRASSASARCASPSARRRRSPSTSRSYKDAIKRCTKPVGGLHQRQHRRHHEHVLPRRRRRGAPPLRQGARSSAFTELLLQVARLDPAPAGHAADGPVAAAARPDARGAARPGSPAAAARSARPRRSSRSSRCTRSSASTSSSTRR